MIVDHSVELLLPLELEYYAFSLAVIESRRLLLAVLR